MGGVRRHRCIEQGPIAVAQDEGHIRAGQRSPPQAFLRMPKLGLGGSQKLAARRHVEKQVTHLDGGSPASGAAVISRRERRGLRWAGVGVLMALIALAADHIVILGGDDPEPRHRRNRRQRLASETESADVQQIVVG